MVPMTEIEYAIIDALADGSLPLPSLVRELHEGRRPWDIGMIVTGLTRLVDRRHIHYCDMPGGPNYHCPSPEAIQAQVLSITRHSNPALWVELADSGQEVWDVWQQSRPGGSPT